MFSGKWRRVIGSMAVEFLMNYFNMCPSAEGLVVTRCMRSTCLIRVLAFLSSWLWGLRQNINRIKNFVFRSSNLEKTGLLFIFLHYWW